MIAFEISRKSQNQSSSLTSTVEEATKSISGQGVETLIMKQRLLFKKKNLVHARTNTKNEKCLVKIAQTLKMHTGLFCW